MNNAVIVAMPDIKDKRIAASVRSAFTAATKRDIDGNVTAEGKLAHMNPVDMVATLVGALLKRTGINPKAIDDVISGTAFPEKLAGLNFGRNVVMHPASGLPDSVPGFTLNMFCASSLRAVSLARSEIMAGNGHAYICTGVELMSQNPDMAGAMGAITPAIKAARPSGFMIMTKTAENLAKLFKIPRKIQEAFALLSHKRAAIARDKGYLAEEIVPMKTPDGKTVDQDDLIRGSSTAEGLAKLRPLYADGTLTAATSSPITDGATAMLVTSEAFAKANNLPILARIVGSAAAGVPPETMGIGPVPAVKKVLEQTGWTIGQVDLFELNEAFAPQALAVLQDLGVPQEKVNVNGGATALGHPLGASGIRILTALVNEMARGKKNKGIATMCVGGGMGMAVAVERYEP